MPSFGYAAIALHFAASAAGPIGSGRGDFAACGGGGAIFVSASALAAVLLFDRSGISREVLAGPVGGILPPATDGFAFDFGDRMATPMMIAMPTMIAKPKQPPHPMP